MISYQKTCLLGALLLCATCWPASEAAAGWRNRGCNNQTAYAAPATTTYYSSTTYKYSSGTAPTTANGRQRYQSAYQGGSAPVSTPVYVAPAPAYYTIPADPVYYSGNHFYDDFGADRKIRDGRVQH